MSTSTMEKPQIVSKDEWLAARTNLLAKEKQLTRDRDALAAERRRMPWQAVEKQYEFDGPKGKVSLLDLFEGRRQLIVYRAFFEPGVFGWPDHACRGCSLGADQVSNLAHLNARDTTLAYASRAPQPDIQRLRRPAQLARRQSYLGFGNHAPRAGEHLFRAESTLRTSQQSPRTNQIAQLRHRNAP